MRRFLIVLALLALVATAGCACQPETQTMPVQPAPASFAPPPAAAPDCAPCSRASVVASPGAPVMLAPDGRAYMAAQPVAVEYRVGAAENMRAALAIPPNVAACFVTGGYKILMAGVEALNCAAQQLIPQPVPTARFVYQMPAPPTAAPFDPCAPRR